MSRPPQRRVTFNDDGSFDELVETKPLLIHIERMGDDCVWMEIEREGMPPVTLNLWAATKNRKRLLYVTVEENL